jgi:hypothetical protein
MNWTHALDLQMDQVKWQTSDVGEKLSEYFFASYFGKIFGTSIDMDDECRKFARNLAISLWRADTMFVTRDMQHVLLQAAHDLPDEVIFDLHTFITPNGFVIFEETVYGTDVNGKVIAVNALTWHTAPNPEDPDHQVICIYFLTPTDDGEDHINREILPEWRERGLPVPPFALSHFYPTVDGDTLPENDAQGAELVVGLLKMFMAMHLLSHQKIGEPMQMRPPRATRRRWNFKEGQRVITLITLRRKTVKKDDHEPQKVEWSRRWIVRGFWRRQWFPKAKRHDWVYIHEYIKGPEDKPLVITERRVFDFRR